MEQHELGACLNRVLVDIAASQEETIKSLKKIILVLLVCFVLVISLMVIGFFCYESQFETTKTTTTTTTTTLETEGENANINNVTNGDQYNDSATHYE